MLSYGNLATVYLHVINQVVLCCCRVYILVIRRYMPIYSHDHISNKTRTSLLELTQELVSVQIDSYITRRLLVTDYPNTSGGLNHPWIGMSHLQLT